MIIRYVNGIVDYGIWFSKDTNFVLARYSDADWAKNADNRKCTISRCFYLGNNLVSWYNKKQNSISLSTAEGEYIVAELLHSTVMDETNACGLLYCSRYFGCLL